MEKKKGKLRKAKGEVAEIQGANFSSKNLIENGEGSGGSNSTVVTMPRASHGKVDPEKTYENVP